MKQKSYHFRVGYDYHSREVEVIPISGNEFRHYKNKDSFFTILCTCMGLTLFFAVPWCFKSLSMSDIENAFVTSSRNFFKPSASAVGTCGNEQGEDK